MEEAKFSFNTQKVHRLNLQIICFMVALIVLPLVIKNGIGNSLLYIIASLSIIGCSFLNYYIKIPNLLKCVLFAALPGTVVFALFFLDGFAINKHYFFFATIVMAAIYFDRKVLIIYGLLIQLYLVTLYMMAPEKLLGENLTLTIFIIQLFVYNGILYMLNKLNEWGAELITSAQKREQETRQLLQESQQLVQKLEQSAHTLGLETEGVNEISNSLAMTSETILSSTEQMAHSIVRP